LPRDAAALKVKALKRTAELYDHDSFSQSASALAEKG